MSKFQTGWLKGEGVVDNLFVLRGLIDLPTIWQKSCG